MAHLSLYRRFRPDTFDKMVRQEHVVRVLTNQIETDAVGHAYLFCGPRGTGKTSVARIFARAVNCEHPKNGSPCGECKTCRALAEGNLDVTEIDAASNNGVNEMRDLREKVQYPPVSGRYKVYIIDEVHMLTDSAFNALLKTLEEPPAHAIFILATTEPHKIPATILSRCMRLDFKLIPEEDLEKHLIGILEEIKKPYEKEAVAAIARAGAGSDRDMLSIAEMCIAYGDKLTYQGVTEALGAADFRETSALAEALLHADSGTALYKTEKILSEGKSVGVLLRDILQLLNQIAVAKTCNTAEKLLSLPKELFAVVKRIADGADGRAILRATEILVKTESELKYAASPRILLETAILRVALPETDYDIDALLIRVKALEEKLAQTPMLLGTPVHREMPVAAVKEVAVKAPERKSTAPEDDFGYPPPEEPMFSKVYEEEPAPLKEEPVPLKEEAATPSKPAPVKGESAEMVFGKFMRTLRKTSKNGVLFTMCADLEARYEGNLLVLYTESDTVLRSLGREEHRKQMAEAFALLGVTEFEVRSLKAPKAEGKDGLEQLKRDFDGYEIEIK